MKKIKLLNVSVSLILSACTKKDTYKKPETEMEKISYSLGLNMATGLKTQGLDSIDVNAFAKAFKDVFEGNDLDISEEESKTILETYSEKLQAEKMFLPIRLEILGLSFDIESKIELNKIKPRRSQRLSLTTNLKFNNRA